MVKGKHVQYLNSCSIPKMFLVLLNWTKYSWFYCSYPLKRRFWAEIFRGHIFLSEVGFPLLCGSYMSPPRDKLRVRLPLAKARFASLLSKVMYIIKRKFKCLSWIWLLFHLVKWKSVYFIRAFGLTGFLCSKYAKYWAIWWGNQSSLRHSWNIHFSLHSMK